MHSKVHSYLAYTHVVNFDTIDFWLLLDRLYADVFVDIQLLFPVVCIFRFKVFDGLVFGGTHLESGARERFWKLLQGNPNRKRNVLCGFMEISFF